MNKMSNYSHINFLDIIHFVYLIVYIFSEFKEKLQTKDRPDAFLKIQFTLQSTCTYC